MALIPEITLTDFRRLVKKPADELKDYQSFNVVAGGETVLTVIIPPRQDAVVADNIRTRAEYLAAAGNSVGGMVPTSTDTTA
jgi:hypothetical protein